MTDQRMLFPEPAKDAENHQKWVGKEWRRHTLSMDPQEGASGFPLPKDSAAKEPLSCSVMLNTARDAVIC